jgi:hypothetical protein
MWTALRRRSPIGFVSDGDGIPLNSAQARLRTSKRQKWTACTAIQHGYFCFDGITKRSSLEFTIISGTTVSAPIPFVHTRATVRCIYNSHLSRVPGSLA